MRMCKGWAAVLVGVICCFCSGSVYSAGFLKFEWIDGEAQDKDHLGWSNLISFEQAFHRSNVEESGGGTRSTVVVEDLQVTKELDKASPKLAEAALTGLVIPKAQIHLTADYGGGVRTTYYAYELKNVMVTSYQVSGSGQNDDPPTEVVSLNFEEIKVTYTEFDDRGAAKGDVEYTWKVESPVAR